MLTTVEKLVLLREARLLKGLPSEELFLLLRVVEEVDLAEGQVLFEQGDAGDQMYIVASGEIGIWRGKGAGQREIAVMRRGEVLGEMAIFNDELRTATAKARSGPVSLLRFFGTGITDLVMEHPSIALSFLREMAQRTSWANIRAEQAIKDLKSAMGEGPKD